MSELTSSEINIALLTLGGLICASIVIHGIKAVPFAKLYARYMTGKAGGYTS